MIRSTRWSRLSISSAVAAACVLATSEGAFAQTAPATAAQSADSEGLTEVVVTGSRIRREGTDTETSAPISVINADTFPDRGFVNAAQAVADLPSAFGSSTPLSPNQGSATAVNGAQYINLLGLGPEHTLTLVNGRRFVSSAPPGGGSNPAGNDLVDPNIIPVGLIDRIEVVEGGGAAVYGSDAIAGVVNYVLKDHFQGIEFDGQTGQSKYGDYPTHSARLTAGTDFADHRGNIAADVEWSETGSLLYSQRPESSTNLVLTPGNQLITNPHFWEFSSGGVLFGIPAPVAMPPFLTPGPGGGGLQFGADGSLVPYNPGQTAVPFGSGGQGIPYGDLSSLFAGVKRENANILGHYDLTDHLKLSTELLYSHVQSDAPFALTQFSDVLSGNAIAFAPNDPRLTPGAAAEIQGLAGAGLFPLGAAFLSKSWNDLLSNNSFITNTNVKRVVLGLDGDFDQWNRNFYWSVSATYGETTGNEQSYDVNAARFNDDLNNVVAGPGGTAVCGPGALPGCSPLNPFGINTVTAAQRGYLDILEGEDYVNQQTDFLATLGGKVIDLPGGPMKFSVGFEHRVEVAEFNPYSATQAGIGVNNNSPVFPTSGNFHTNEESAELAFPIFGKDFTIPGVKALDFDSAIRFVDNSLAGSNSAWNIGLRWTTVQGVTFRGTHSTDFRAPSLTQVFSPTTSGLGPSVQDPCSSTFLFEPGQPNQSARLAHCQAEWNAHGQYGGNPLSANAAAAANGVGFTDGNDFIPAVEITNSGNPDLKNERSVTNSFGIVLQPWFAPGLEFAADRVEINLDNGLVSLNMQTLLSLCYDQPSFPNAYCGDFTRDPATGQVVTGRTLEAVNAAQIEFRGETYNLRYNTPLNSLFRSSGDWGNVGFNMLGTHVSHLSTSFILDGSPTEIGDSAQQPTWVARLDVRYALQKFQFFYTVNYLGRTQVTNPNSPDALFPFYASNTRHNITASYQFFDHLTLRAGVINLTNTRPSYPSISYGDIVGAQWFVGLNARY
jgi:iron complex outermembrane receptor protein